METEELALYRTDRDRWARSRPAGGPVAILEQTSAGRRVFAGTVVRVNKTTVTVARTGSEGVSWRFPLDTLQLRETGGFHGRYYRLRPVGHPDVVELLGVQRRRRKLEAVRTRLANAARYDDPAEGKQELREAYRLLHELVDDIA